MFGDNHIPLLAQGSGVRWGNPDSTPTHPQGDLHTRRVKLADGPDPHGTARNRSALRDKTNRMSAANKYLAIAGQMYFLAVVAGSEQGPTPTQKPIQHFVICIAGGNYKT